MVLGGGKDGRRLVCRAVAGALGLTASLWFAGAGAATSYRPIDPTPPASDQRVTLTGHDLTVEQLVAAARFGQAVEVTPEARRHQDDAHALMLQGAMEGMPIPGFNRGGPAGNAVLFEGDPTAPEIAAGLRQRAMEVFAKGAVAAGSAQIAEEEVVRAIMVVRANTLTYAPAGSPMMQMLVDFLNYRIAPVTPMPGPATGTEVALAGIAAAMVGTGEVYYHGIRTSAAEALSRAGLTPLTPSDADYAAFTETDAYDIGRTALLVADGRRALEWTDLIYAMNLDGMGAGLAPLSLPAQANRPFKWIYWDAARVLDMLKGSYLFDDAAGTTRVYPPTMTLSPTRQGAAWRAWGALRDATLIALNSSDQSPAFRVGLSPRESPELSTPQMLRYLVKGGKLNGGKRGYIVPALNRDPFPMADEIAFFAAAMATLDLAIAQRTGAPLPGAPSATDEGMIAISQARQALDATFGLLVLDLTNAVKLMDARAAEDPMRVFGLASAAARTAFRLAIPQQTSGDAVLTAAFQFIQANPPAAFYPKGSQPPGTDDPIPLAQEKLRP